MEKKIKRRLLGGAIFIITVAAFLLFDGDLSDNDLSFMLDAIDFVFRLLR